MKPKQNEFFKILNLANIILKNLHYQEKLQFLIRTKFRIENPLFIKNNIHSYISAEVT